MPDHPPKYPALVGSFGGMAISLAVYFAMLFPLDAAGLPTLAAAIIACPIGVAAAWAFNHALYHWHTRRSEAWYAAEAQRRAAERLASFDAHVRALRIFSDRPQG